MKKIKVAIIGSNGYPFVYGGYETFVKELVERIVPIGLEVTVYSRKNNFNIYPASVNGVKIIYIKTIQRKNLAQLIYGFQSFIHASLHNFDIILVLNSANGIFGIISKSFRKKTIINVDGVEWLRPKWKGLGAIYYYYSSKLATKLFDIVITDSIEMQSIYRKHFHVNTEVIAYGANIKYSDKKDFVYKWNLESRKYYLVVGRLIPDNNADYVISEYLNSSSSKRLVIVGDDIYNSNYAIKLKSIKSSRILFTGYIRNQDELAQLFLNCFVYIHGHEFGGTNPTLLEALATGCAILALDTPFNNEVLSSKKYGMYFKKTKGRLTEQIEYIENSSDELLQYRINARERIKEKYTWTKIVDKYLQQFNNLTKKS